MLITPKNHRYPRRCTLCGLVSDRLGTHLLEEHPEVVRSHEIKELAKLTGLSDAQCGALRRRITNYQARRCPRCRGLIEGKIVDHLLDHHGRELAVAAHLKLTAAQVRTWLFNGGLANPDIFEEAMRLTHRKIAEEEEEVDLPPNLFLFIIDRKGLKLPQANEPCLALIGTPHAAGILHLVMTGALEEERRNG